METQGGNSISKSKFEGDEHLSAESCGHIQIVKVQIKKASCHFLIKSLHF